MSDVTKLNFNGEINEFADEIARGLIGNVEDLQTEAKDSLVNALNEVDDKSSGLNDEIAGVKRRLTSAEENIVHVTSEIGEMNQLKTTDKSTMVNAINEIFDRSDESVIGDLDDLTTTEKSTIVGAINEVNSGVVDAVSDIGTLETAVGDLADLDTTDKSSIVNAINEVAGNASDERIGDLNDLTTTEKSTVVGAINEVNTGAGNAQNDVSILETSVGDLADLDTTDKSSVVGAINEANTKAGNAQNDVDALETAVGDLADLDTTDKTSVVGAINEANTKAGNAQNDVGALETAVGDLADLNTVDKSSIVDAINEVNVNTGHASNVLAELTSDGTQTYTQFLSALYAELISNHADYYKYDTLFIKMVFTATNSNVCIASFIGNTSIQFTSHNVYDTLKISTIGINIGTNNSKYYETIFENNNVTMHDYSNSTVVSGVKYQIIRK